jgi:hypothetical protein
MMGFLFNIKVSYNGFAIPLCADIAIFFAAKRVYKKALLNYLKQGD